MEENMNQKLSSTKPLPTYTFLICFLLITGFFYFVIFNAKADAKVMADSFSSIAEATSPAVINIRAEKTIKGGGRVFRHFFNMPDGYQNPMEEYFNRFYGNRKQREFKQQSLGSGFLIDKEGYIVTNNHVVENANKIKVIMKNGKELEATIIGLDSTTDLALIKIEPGQDLPTLKFGDSNLSDVGEWVVAIGNPFGLGHTVTAGIISAKGRVIGSGPYDDFIQTDASINPGNSGGPLLNMAGEVVGINTAIMANGQGIGFAIPVSLAKGIIDQLKKNGEVIRGWLGVMIQDLNQGLAEYYGVNAKTGALVADVLSGDPADLSGIKPNDIIIRIDDKSVESSRDLTQIVADIPVGSKVKITVLRDGSPKNFDVKIAKRDTSGTALQERGGDPIDELGLKVSELTPEINRRLNISDTKGLVVVEIVPQTKSAQADIQVDDIILEVNNEPITSATKFGTLVREVKKGESIKMLVKRMNTGYMVVTLKK
jgi:serine protease Do